MKIRNFIFINIIAAFLVCFPWLPAQAAQDLSVNSLIELAALKTDGAEVSDAPADYVALGTGDWCKVSLSGVPEDRYYIYFPDNGEDEDENLCIAPDYVSDGVPYTGDGRWIYIGRTPANVDVVNDSSYGSAWNTDLNHAPSRHAVYAKISSLAAADVGAAPTSHNHAASDINSGVYPIARGGTNSGTALANNRIMESIGDAIVEAAALTANRALVTNASGLPIASAVTDTELGYISGLSSAIQTQLNAKAPLASPTLTGTPAAPTAAVDTNTTQLATAAFVVGQAGAANPVMDGTAAPGTSLRYSRQDHVHPVDTSRAASSHNHAASDVNSGVFPIARGGTNSGTTLSNNRIMESIGGAIVEAAALTANRALVTNASGLPIASSVTDAELGYISGLASAIQTQLNAKAPLASPTLTGIPAAPTAVVDTNTTQLSTTAYVLGQAGAANPVMDGTAAPGTSLRYSRQDHVHPVDTSRAATSHAHAASDVNSGIFDIARIPTGTTGTTVSLGNHTHAALYAPLLADPGYNGPRGWDDTDNAETFFHFDSSFTYTHSTHTISVTGSSFDPASPGNLGTTTPAQAHFTSIFADDITFNQKAGQAGRWAGLEFSGNGTNYLAIEVPDAITANRIYKLIDAAPPSGGGFWLWSTVSGGISTQSWIQLDADTTLAGNSDTRLATQKATKAYVDTHSGSGADALGYYLVGRSTNAPANAINLGALTTGVVKQTVSGGVATFSSQASEDDLVEGTTYKRIIAADVNASHVRAIYTTDATPRKISFSGLTADRAIPVPDAAVELVNLSSTQTLTNKSLTSPTLTGTPLAPTAAADTNTTQIATTAFAVGQAGTSNPVIDGTAAPGTSLKYSRQDHVHPTDTSRAALASPTFTGTPAAPTAAADTNTTQLATTAYVIAQAGTSNPVMDGTAAPGTSLKYSRQDHVHPTDTALVTLTTTQTLSNKTMVAPILGVATATSLTTTKVSGTAGTVKLAGASGAGTDGPILTGPASASSSETVTVPNVAGTVAVSPTTTQTTYPLFGTATAGLGGYRAIAGTDLPNCLNSFQGLSETNGGFPYGTGDNGYAWKAAGNAGEILVGAGAGAPVWVAAGTTAQILVGAGAASPVWTTATGTGAPVRAISPALTGDVDINATSLKIPNWATTGTLDAAGKIGISQNNMAISSYINDAAAEIAGEASISFMQHFSICFDPKSVYDQTAVHRLLLMTVGKEAPNGILIHKWSLSFQADPTTELTSAAVFKRADAFTTVANAGFISDGNHLLTTAGVVSQDTDANINGGAAVATTKVLYLELGADPVDTANLCIFEFWYTIEED